MACDRWSNILDANSPQPPWISPEGELLELQKLQQLHQDQLFENAILHPKRRAWTQSPELSLIEASVFCQRNDVLEWFIQEKNLSKRISLESHWFVAYK